MADALPGTAIRIWMVEMLPFTKYQCGRFGFCVWVEGSPFSVESSNRIMVSIAVNSRRWSTAESFSIIRPTSSRARAFSDAKVCCPLRVSQMWLCLPSSIERTQAISPRLLRARRRRAKEVRCSKCINMIFARFSIVSVEGVARWELGRDNCTTLIFRDLNLNGNGFIISLGSLPS